MKCGAANVGRLNKLRWCEHHHNLCHNRDDHNDMVRSQKKITGLFGNFFQMADPPPIPPFGNPLFKKKNRLFCILDP